MAQALATLLEPEDGHKRVHHTNVSTFLYVWKSPQWIKKKTPTSVRINGGGPLYSSWAGWITPATVFSSAWETQTGLWRDKMDEKLCNKNNNV